MIPPKPQDAKWNDEQWEAIYANKAEILISAGAGSGKTAVLVERIIQKILIKNINVDELLVLTFTEAAAAEMKERIRLRIEEELQKQPKNKHLNKQLNKISRAMISTFHSFCNQLIKKYYFLIGIDPTFKIADDIERSILQDEVMENLFDSLSESEHADFLFLSDSFNSDRDDESLKVMVIKIYELARSNPDMMEWLTDLPQHFQWDHKDLKSWKHYDKLLELINPSLKEMKSDLEAAKAYALDSEMMGISHKYPAEVYHQDVAYLERIFKAKEISYQELRETFTHSNLVAFPRLNKKNFDEEMHAKSKEARDIFKKEIEKIKKKFFCYSNETHEAHFKQSEKVIKALAELTLKFHEQFTLAKSRQQLLDFSDLEWGTLALLKKEGQATDIALEVYHQFKEIMIDEYQDTNSMQERIITAISKVSKPSIPVFMVGDVKQSIYRFRLAEPGIFKGKYQTFTNEPEQGLKIDLMKNYRSHQQVIDGTNFIFKQIMDESIGEIEYDEAAMLRLGVENEINEVFNRSELHLIDKKQFEEDSEDLNVIELEAHHIARTILGWIQDKQEIFDRKNNEKRLLRYQDVVILMRSLSHVTIFQDIFKQYHIPLFTEQNTDLFDSIEIINILSCLKVIDNPYQDIPLAGLMRSPLFFFTEKELAEIKVSGVKASYFDLVMQYAKNGENELLKEKVTTFIHKIERWRFDAKMMPISQLINLIYEQTLYYEFVLGLPHGTLRKANLDVFKDRAQAYEKNTKRGLYGFISFIERMQNLGKHFGKAKTVTANENVVRIMSIHKSKGLEFPVVFVSQIHKQFNQQDELGNYVMHKEFGIAVKYIDPILRFKQKTIAGNLVSSLIHQEMLAEEMRLLYVAMTRAKSKILFTGVFDIERKMKAIKPALQESEYLLPTAYRLKAKNYGDWLIPAVFRQANVQKDIEEFIEEPAKILSDSSEWSVKVINEHETLDSDSILNEKEKEKIEIPVVDIEKLFSNAYEFEGLLTINAKQSVSQRKEEESIPMFKGIPELKPRLIYDRPSFMKTSTLTGAEIGTALHQFMQHLPIRTDYSLEDLKEIRTNIVKQEMMKENMAMELNLDQILLFTQSELYANFKKAIQIKKEVPFMTLIQINEQKQSQILLQGVIDLLVEFEKEVWIIDYKTDFVEDFVKDKEKLKERYAIQMKYYSKAIKEIYPTKKVTCYVYFLSVQESIAYE